MLQAVSRSGKRDNARESGIAFRITVDMALPFLLEVSKENLILFGDLRIMPGWRNGRRKGLKIHLWHFSTDSHFDQLAGS